MKIIYIINLLLLLFCSCGSKKDTKNVQVSPQEQKMEQYKQYAENVHKLLQEDEENYDPCYNMKFDSFNSIQYTIPKYDCGTKLTDIQFREISKIKEEICGPEKIPDDEDSQLIFQIQIFILSNNSNQSIEESEIRKPFNILNEKFSPGRIKFQIVRTQVLYEESLYNCNVKQAELALIKTYKKQKTINVFIVSSLRDTDGAILNGYTTFDKFDDYILITAEALKKRGNTLSHEMGHFFFLYHTHGKKNRGGTDELVSRNQCTCSGDEICDTPADPNLDSRINGNCEYTGGDADPNGIVYQPDTRNIMSYSGSCRFNFTLGQYRRMRYYALNLRNYLLK